MKKFHLVVVSGVTMKIWCRCNVLHSILVKDLMPYICCLRYTSIHLFSATILISTFCFMDTLTFSLSGCSTAKTKNISYSELRRATNNFHQSNKIGRGGFGIVYKVQLYSINTSLRLYAWALLHGQLPFAWNSHGAIYRITLPKPLDVCLIIYMKRLYIYYLQFSKILYSKHVTTYYVIWFSNFLPLKESCFRNILSPAAASVRSWFLHIRNMRSRYLENNKVLGLNSYGALPCLLNDDLTLLQLCRVLWEME